MRLSAFCLALLVCLPARAAGSEVRVVQRLELPVAGPAATTHALKLELYAFRDSLWHADAIAQAADGAARVLAQCDVGVTELSLTTLEAPERLRAYSTPMARELLREIPARKPAIFFVDRTLNRPAYDAEAIGLANAGGRPELAHTVWVAHGARDLPLVLAHELVHVLTNTGAHSMEPFNLMQAETAPQNDRLTEAQCERIVDTGVTQRLLEPDGGAR